MTTITVLTKLLGKLAFTTEAVLAKRIQWRYLQNQQIQALRQTNSYQAKIILNKQSLAKIKWWKENLLLQNGRPLKIGLPELIIQTNASKTDWGQFAKESKQKNMVISGTEKACQRPRTSGGKVCNIDLYPRKISENSPLTNGQYHSPHLSFKSGWYPQSGTSTNIKRNMALIASQSDHCYSRVLAKQPECSGRLGFQKSQGFKQLETKSSVILSNDEHQRCSTDRSMCLLPKQLTSKVHALGSRPRELCSGLPSIRLEEPLRVCVLSILLNRKGTSQSKEGPVSASHNNTSMAN